MRQVCRLILVLRLKTHSTGTQAEKDRARKGFLQHVTQTQLHEICKAAKHCQIHITEGCADFVISINTKDQTGILAGDEYVPPVEF